MSKKSQIPNKILNLIKSFKSALKKTTGFYLNRRSSKDIDTQSYYEEAKIAETQERNLYKALELYIKAIENGQKKDSSIKDFASSLHQLGYTKEAVRLMDECQIYYDGNKEKYFRLRDNLQIQINPTGKHLCRYILIENLNHQILRLETQEQIKKALFKSPKRIKKISFFKDFDLLKTLKVCEQNQGKNLLVEFQSFSAAKKTLESFFFDQWFGCNLYWVNYQNMRITCAAIDGKKDFEEGFVLDEHIIKDYLYEGKQTFWSILGQQVYSNKQSNGFINLLSTHLIKEFLCEECEARNDKENIFERSKINQNYYKQNSSSENSLQNVANNNYKQKYNQNYYENYYDESRDKNRKRGSYKSHKWY